VHIDRALLRALGHNDRYRVVPFGGRAADRVLGDDGSRRYGVAVFLRITAKHKLRTPDQVLCLAQRRHTHKVRHRSALVHLFLADVDRDAAVFRVRLHLRTGDRVRAQDDAARLPLGDRFSLKSRH